MEGSTPHTSVPGPGHGTLDRDYHRHYYCDSTGSRVLVQTTGAGAVQADLYKTLSKPMVGARVTQSV